MICWIESVDPVAYLCLTNQIYSVLLNAFEFNEITEVQNAHLKDGACYCYCAYVLRISRHSDFLSVMLTNIGIFLRGLKLPGESKS